MNMNADLATLPESDLAAMDAEIIGQHLIKVFQYRIENPLSSVKDATEALHLPYSSVLRWINEGKFASYLAQIHDARSDLAQSVALNNLPGIVQSMSDIATGARDMRGSNPQAAAEFVLKIAQLGARAEARNTGVAVQVNTYMPGLGDSQQPGGHESHQAVDVIDA